MTGKTVPAEHLTRLIGAIFESLGLAADDATCTAQSLVSADLEGIPSHGVSLVPMYVQRIKAGSINVDGQPSIVEDHGAMVIMTAANTLGQLSSEVAVKLAIERAQQHGISIVTVRDAFHFGTAAYWSKKFAHAGMVGFSFSNTRPLMPAPGGAQALVGNNPMAIAFPSATGDQLVVDMAMSATAMGKIRIAQAQGKSIPEGWATDAEGRATTSASDAINGMLLPAAGPKGFGLAVAVDLLCGALSGGGVGAAVRPLYGDTSQPYNCSHAFIAIDASRIAGGSGIGLQVAQFSQSIRDSRRASGTETIYAPGDLERANRQRIAGNCVLHATLIDELNALAKAANSDLRL
ncbi:MULTISPECIES: Ldh family oxidoreductase [unclassified Pseudomonas]|uniref:Ldh family oxidoreductase n=1 Tax=unclassified Pseudomonas TaxID=196821 RepID=UPI000812B828|nr:MULTISPECIES: Ldh family oxidoreductase [unclassified Pseudomonas]WPN52028.1 Ldh family oxidoreductase [Pseudomonas sp. P9_2]CRM80463.1 putative oxidoreductase YjmC [Pseudomonas sp. 25 R 14]